MKQDYTLAYLSYCAGLRLSVPNPSAYRRVLADGTTKPLTADEGRAIQGRVDAIIDDIRRVPDVLHDQDGPLRHLVESALNGPRRRFMSRAPPPTTCA